MNATGPVNDENELGSFLINIGYHFMNERTYDALLQPCIGRCCSPDSLQVSCEHSEECRVSGGRWPRCLMRRYLAFDGYFLL
jgi:hypothetical protein